MAEAAPSPPPSSPDPLPIHPDPVQTSSSTGCVTGQSGKFKPLATGLIATLSQADVSKPTGIVVGAPAKSIAQAEPVSEEEHCRPCKLDVASLSTSSTVESYSLQTPDDLTSLSSYSQTTADASTASPAMLSSTRTLPGQQEPSYREKDIVPSQAHRAGSYMEEQTPRTEKALETAADGVQDRLLGAGLDIRAEHQALHPPFPLEGPPNKFAADSQDFKNMGNDTFNDSISSQIPGEKNSRPRATHFSSAPTGRLSHHFSSGRSQYSSSQMPPQALVSSSTSLAKLAYLIKQQSYQEHRRCQERVRLYRFLVSNTLSTRLLRCAGLAYRGLVDNFRSDDEKSFATLYEAFHDVRSSCEAYRRYALLEPDLDFTLPRSTASERPMEFHTTFLDEMPAKSRDEILSFLAELRSNPSFLATRLASLTTQELSSLITHHQFLDPVESIIGMGIKRNAYRSQPKHANNSQSPNAVERLLSFQRHDPLSALIFTIFANSSGPDSAEDTRRTNVWATACARLIVQKSGWSKFLCSVLDVWTALRDWPAKTGLELYLMEVIQEGQFLLEMAEESHPAQRNGMAPMTTKSNKESIAIEEFFDKAVKRLFEIIDDEPTAGGIPYGALEIGRAILEKLDRGGEDSKKHCSVVRNFIVNYWLFSNYLFNVIIHPEYHGLLIGHHISEHARQIILKEIASRCQDNVAKVISKLHQPPAVIPEIQTHVRNILSRFKSRSSITKHTLIPAKAINSSPGTKEAKPFLVMCPSDIVTIVNALFPDRQSSPAGDRRDWAHGRTGSATSSTSGLSVGLQKAIGDACSVLSMSVSSRNSDTASQQPLLYSSNGPALSGEFTPSMEGGNAYLSSVVPTDDYGRHIKTICSEMTSLLNQDPCAYLSHPCAEMWTVLYVSADGRELSNRMRKDLDDDDDTEDDQTDFDSSTDEAPAEELDLEFDYHQMKRAVAKLVSEFEIPADLPLESESKSFSSRTSMMRRGHTVAYHPHQANSNPFRVQGRSSVNTLEAEGPVKQNDETHTLATKVYSNDSYDKPSLISTMLETAAKQCVAQHNYFDAHLYDQTLQQLRSLSTPSLTRNGYASLLNCFSRSPRDSLMRATSAMEEFEAWFVCLKEIQARYDDAIEVSLLSLKQLRDKMWYTTHVRSSKIYGDARNVAVALKMMGQPARMVDGKPITIQRHRPHQRQMHNFWQKAEEQTFEVMAAPIEVGGPNKLADEQADLTKRWLKQLDIVNFCKGEERIHRFSFEMHKCVNSLVGESMLERPILWSGDLYRRDRENFDSGRQKGDLFMTRVGTLSIAGNEEDETLPIRNPYRSLDFAPRQYQSTNTLRHSSRQFASQYSVLDKSFRGNQHTDALLSRGHSESAHFHPKIDCSSTFWSPFQTGKEGTAAGGLGNIRTRTSSAMKETVMLQKSANVHEDKRRFLQSLKRALTGLLLSDLGMLVFNNGSETDGWFAGELVEECLRDIDLDFQQSEPGAAPHSRAASHATREYPLQNPQIFSAGLDAGLPRANTSVSNLSVPERSAGESKSRKYGASEFPFKLAFKTTFRRFAANPNPFIKFQLLYELHRLVTAQLTSQSQRHTNHSRKLDSEPRHDSAQLSYTVSNAAHSPDGLARTGAGKVSSPPRQIRNAPSLRSFTGQHSTGAVVNVLYNLLRDAGMRPQTLFRDLQYIASFVPPRLLEKTAQGKVFWDVSIAAQGLQEDVRRLLVEKADKIVETNEATRDASMAAIVAASSTTAPLAARASRKNDTTGSDLYQAGQDEPTNTIHENENEKATELPKYSMADAAARYIIAAREGHPVAQRELAILYMQQSELLPRMIMPLCQIRDVIKPEMIASIVGSGDSQAAVSGSRASMPLSTTGVGLGPFAAAAASSGNVGAGSDARVRGVSVSFGAGVGAGTGVGAVGASVTAAGPAVINAALPPVSGSGRVEHARSDLVTNLVQHWMKLASQGGDEVAMDFMRGRVDGDRKASTSVLRGR